MFPTRFQPAPAADIIRFSFLRLRRLWMNSRSLRKKKSTESKNTKSFLLQQTNLKGHVPVTDSKVPPGTGPGTGTQAAALRRTALRAGPFDMRPEFESLASHSVVLFHIFSA
jgi:hypothetical protein